MTSKENGQNEMLFSAKQLSEVLNISQRRVQQLAEEDVVVKQGRGKYKMLESVSRYIRYLQERSASDDGLDYNREHALLERAKRQKAELQLSVMKGDLHRSRDVETVMNDMVASFRSKCLAIPTKLAPQLLNKKGIAEVRDKITVEMHEALSELSEYDPQAFYANSEDYVELTEDEDSE